MITIDLYTPYYLGELETTLIEKNSSGTVVFKVRLFSAKFLSILDYIPYDETSHPQSINYLVNMAGQNWGEDDFSLVHRLQEFYDQLVSIESLVDPLRLEEYNAIKQICLSALQNGNGLYIILYN